MVKKILGFIFIILSIIFGVVFFVQLPKTLSMFSDFSSYTFGYLSGSLVFLVISIFLFRIGIKLSKNK